MDNSEKTPREEKRNLFQALRALVLPIKPTDGALVKAGKTAGFFVFAVFATLVSVAIGLAVTFVL